MTVPGLFVLFVLPLSLLLLGGVAMLLHNRSSKGTSQMAEQTAIAVTAEVEKRLAEALELAPDAGASLTIHNESGRVVGILLTRDEYELLNAVAAVARDNDRISIQDTPGEPLVSYEEAFDSRGG